MTTPFRSALALAVTLAISSSLTAPSGPEGATSARSIAAAAGTWAQIPSATPPYGLSGSMACDPANGGAVLFGSLGEGSGVHLNATWTWDGTNWTEKHPIASPAPRQHASMACDPTTGMALL